MRRFEAAGSKILRVTDLGFESSVLTAARTYTVPEREFTSNTGRRFTTST